MRVEIKGLDAVLKKLSPKLWGTPLKRFWERAGETILGVMKGRAPVDSGRLTTSLGRGAAGNIWEMDSGTVPQYHAIGTNVQAHGFSYPAALDASARYHYKGGKAEGATHPKATGPRHESRTGLYGQPTKGWFSESPQLAQGDLNKWLDKMADEIAEGFGGK